MEKFNKYKVKADEETAKKKAELEEREKKLKERREKEKAAEPKIRELTDEEAEKLQKQQEPLDVVENKKDDLATSTVQMGTEFDKDARTIFENSLPSKPLVHIQVFLSPE